MKQVDEKKSWDIFCKIIDNFGDIGVCWRLAKQLQSEYKLNIRLWIDDLNAAQKIIPQLNVHLNRQIIDDIYVLSWHAQTKFTDASDIVIEAFSCELPSEYIGEMVQKKSTWINLEYLSAESWVADFHAKPSPRANGLTRYFYFPGFTQATGGLIRENNIIHQNQHLSSDKSQQNLFWQSVNLTNNKHLKVSLFCYPHAPIESLLMVMAESNQPIHCYVPASNILSKVADFFGLSHLNIGENYQLKQLNLHILPFLSQADYDQLLSVCDINFVRGEDSWIRAIWAAKPFIWQPYFQAENTHIQKLSAFLDLFYANLNAKQAVLHIHHAWVSGQITATIWQAYLNHLIDISAHTLLQSQQLARQTDLAKQLVIFCNKN